jgi:hypothetical protein
LKRRQQGKGKTRIIELKALTNERREEIQREVDDDKNTN